MLGTILKVILGDASKRAVKKIVPTANKINQFYETLQNLSDEELKGKTAEFRRRLKDGETLDDLLPEAYAVVKEACRRHLGKQWEVTEHTITWDMVPFDVQLIGAVVLHQGKIAEMATGEGKTLVAIMPIYLNALEGKGCHLVTVNDYLARRDAQWMGKILEFLGLTVGCIQNEMESEERRKQYACDVTYGTNNEFGFDYLRDNMALSIGDVVQRGHHYAIIDEVDNILIDEARTPLIISGQVERSTQRYDRMKPLVEKLFNNQKALINRYLQELEDLLQKEADSLEAGKRLLQAKRGLPKNKKLMKMLREIENQRLVDKVELETLRDKKMPELDSELYFVIDEKGHNVDITDKGRECLSPDMPDRFLIPDLVEEIQVIDSNPNFSSEEKEKKKEEIRGLFDIRTEEIHNISQLLRAYCLFEKDVDYVIQENKILIVDEFTGRLMPGRRWSDGLHQAVEAKEGVVIEKESQTLATITLQNYFRMYKKRAGMTGTAETEASEFFHTYKMDVVVVPTNQPMIRMDYDDIIYLSKHDKYNAVLDEIERCYNAKRPVLVGTVSVDVSETLSRMLRTRKIPHNVLNAKYHQREAEIITQAGQPGAVTIATNMAGRGTDIKLGPGVVKCKACCVRCKLSCSECPDDNKKSKYPECYKDVPCGLQVIGTERHEARRIDRQLRGRSGRQGDPGSSRFYLSLEDDLMRLFIPEKIANLMGKMGFQEGQDMQHPLVTRSVASAQKKVEMINFERRKHTLEYDDVMNRQREIIYGIRRDALEGKDMKDFLLEACMDAINDEFDVYCNPSESENKWNKIGFREWIAKAVPNIDLSGLDEKWQDKNHIVEKLGELIEKAYSFKKELIGENLVKEISRISILRTIDENWIDHLLEMDELKEGIGLRGYAQVDPLFEYKAEAYKIFEELIRNIKKAVFERFFRTQIMVELPQQVKSKSLQSHPDYVSLEELARHRAMMAATGRQGEESPVAYSRRQRRHMTDASESGPKRQPIVKGKKVGRNEPCPCGSGKKYKKCCGKFE